MFKQEERVSILLDYTGESAIRRLLSKFEIPLQDNRKNHQNLGNKLLAYVKNI